MLHPGLDEQVRTDEGPWSEATLTLVSGGLAQSWREEVHWKIKLYFESAMFFWWSKSLRIIGFLLGPLSFQSPTPNTLVPPASPAPATPSTPPVRRCDSNSCFRGVRCTDTRDGFQCGPCPEGYTGNGITCSDIDEVEVQLPGTGVP